MPHVLRVSTWRSRSAPRHRSPTRAPTRRRRRDRRRPTTIRPVATRSATDPATGSPSGSPADPSIDPSTLPWGPCTTFGIPSPTLLGTTGWECSTLDVPMDPFDRRRRPAAGDARADAPSGHRHAPGDTRDEPGRPGWVGPRRGMGAPTGDAGRHAARLRHRELGSAWDRRRRSLRSTAVTIPTSTTPNSWPTAPTARANSRRTCPARTRPPISRRSAWRSARTGSTTSATATARSSGPPSPPTTPIGSAHFVLDGTTDPLVGGRRRHDRGRLPVLRRRRGRRRRSTGSSNCAIRATPARWVTTPARRSTSCGRRPTTYRPTTSTASRPRSTTRRLRSRHPECAHVCRRLAAVRHGAAAMRVTATHRRSPPSRPRIRACHRRTRMPNRRLDRRSRSPTWSSTAPTSRRRSIGRRSATPCPATSSPSTPIRADRRRPARSS